MSSLSKRNRPRVTLAWGLIGSALAATTIAIGACGSDSESEQGGVLLHGEQEVLPGFEYSTGLQPSGSPVQASFELSASGTATVDAKANPSGSSAEPELTGIAGTGTIALTGGFSMIGTLKVDIDGLPSYDGPIPGLEDVTIAFEGQTTFDPFSVDQLVSAQAPIPPTELPPIPLPGGIPGSLVLEVAEGSFVEIGFTATCAAISSDTAHYEGVIARGGSLVIKPSVVIEVPLFGEKAFEIPSFTVDLALGSEPIAMTAAVTEYGDPIAGDKATVGTCSPDGSGGAGQGGGAPEGGSGAGGSDAGGSGAGGSGSVDAYPICDSGWFAAGEECATCLGAVPSCCQAITDCSDDPACEACFTDNDPTACDESDLIPTLEGCFATCRC